AFLPRGVEVVQPRTAARAKKPTPRIGAKRAKPEAMAALALTPKGEAARERILAVALEAFGRRGFRNATTREIAEAAGVNLPALKYYFGSKEDLYRACAKSVVDRYRAQTDAIAEQARAVLVSRPSPEAARLQLKELMHALTILLTGSREAPIW